MKPDKRFFVVNLLLYTPGEDDFSFLVSIIPASCLDDVADSLEDLFSDDEACRKQNIFQTHYMIIGVLVFDDRAAAEQRYKDVVEAGKLAGKFFQQGRGQI